MPDIVQPTPTAAASSIVQGGKYVIGCPEKYGHMQKNMVKWGIPEKGIKMQLRNVELGSVGHSIQSYGQNSIVGNFTLKNQRFEELSQIKEAPGAGGCASETYSDCC